MKAEAELDKERIARGGAGGDGVLCPETGQRGHAEPCFNCLFRRGGHRGKFFLSGIAPIISGWLQRVLSRRKPKQARRLLQQFSPLQENGPLQRKRRPKFP